MPPQQLFCGGIVCVPPLQKKLAPNPSPLSGSISTSLTGVIACTIWIAGGVTVCHCALSPFFGYPAGAIWKDRPCPHSLAVLKLPLLMPAQSFPPAPSPYPEHEVISTVPARACEVAQVISQAPPASTAIVAKATSRAMYRRPCISARGRAEQLHLEGLRRELPRWIVGIHNAGWRRSAQSY